MQIPVEATTENQEDAGETQENVEIETQGDVVTQEPTYSQKDSEVDRNGFQEEDVVTQERASLELIAEIPIQAEMVGRLVEEEFVTLLIQNDQAETLGNEVWTQFSHSFVDSDSDKENDVKDRMMQVLIGELSLVKIEVKIWNC